MLPPRSSILYSCTPFARHAALASESKNAFTACAGIVDDLSRDRALEVAGPSSGPPPPYSTPRPSSSPNYTAGALSSTLSPLNPTLYSRASSPPTRSPLPSPRTPSRPVTGTNPPAPSAASHTEKPSSPTCHLLSSIAYRQSTGGRGASHRRDPSGSISPLLAKTPPRRPRHQQERLHPPSLPATLPPGSDTAGELAILAVDFSADSSRNRAAPPAPPCGHNRTPRTPHRWLALRPVRAAPHS
jgi:hypothetical protein